MTDFEYDKNYDELCELEKELGEVLPNSVTKKVGYVVQSKLSKINYNSSILHSR